MKKKVLHIQSSIHGEQSYSTKLGNAIIEKIKESSTSEIDLKARNLVEEDFPHLNGEVFKAFFTTKEQLPEQQLSAVRISEASIREVMEADILVIGAPLYNFGIPSQLKAWLDHISRAGITFRYDENGPRGLVENKKVYIAMASGGVYSEGPGEQMDFVSTYLKAILGFLGMTDVEIIRVEGTASAETKDTALDKALSSIQVEQLVG